MPDKATTKTKPRSTPAINPDREGYATDAPDTNSWQTFLIVICVLGLIGLVGGTIQWLLS